MADNRFLGPRPSVGMADLVSADLPSPLIGSVSGEITLTKRGLPLAAAQIGGSVRKVWFSVLKNGKINANPLSIAVDVKINGTSCLSTQPAIAASSSAATNKTTVSSGTGITEGVVDTDNNTYDAGDVLTFDAILTRTDSPTTEIANLVVVVELDPA